MNNQTVLVSVIFALVLVIGVLVLGHEREHETLGEKVGHSIDHAAYEITGDHGDKR